MTTTSSIARDPAGFAAEMMQKKAALRASLLAVRRAIPITVRAQLDALIRAQVLDWWTRSRVASLGVYWPIQCEPDLRPLYAELSAHGVRLALPTVTLNDAALTFVAWTPGDALIQDAMGVSIPANRDTTLQPEALLIPCVGFNTTGHRLGYGGGFYDRTLALAPRPRAIGVAYQCGLVEFETATHDIALDAIITEVCGDSDEQSRAAEDK